MIQDEDFIAGVRRRRCLAWLIDAVLIGVVFLLTVLVLSVFGVMTLGLGFGAMVVLPAVPVLRARPPFSAQVRVQRICMMRIITSTATPNAAASITSASILWLDFFGFSAIGRSFSAFSGASGYCQWRDRKE